MTKKVFELAREMGVPSKELVSRASAMGIDVKNHMSVLSEQDAAKLRGNGAGQDNRKQKTAGHKPPIGVPIVDEEFLANRHRPPAGRPVVDEDMLARREAKKNGTSGDDKAQAAPQAEKKVEKPAAAPEPKKEPAAEKPERKAEGKAEAKASEKKSAEKPADKKPADKPAEKKAAEKKSAEKPSDKAPEKKTEKKPEDRPIKALESERITGIKVIKRAAQNPVKKEEGGQDRRKNNGGAKDNRRGGRDNRGGEGRGNGRDNRRAGGRNGQGGQNGRNDRNNNDRNNNGRRRPGERPAAPGGNRPMHADAGASRPSGGGNAHGRKNNRRGRNDDRSKFAKFEQKSLEKKERKKYNKPKQEAEPETMEEALPEGTIRINVPITVAGFCEQAEVSTSRVIMTLMKMGVMANINQNIDEDTVLLLADELGIQVAIGKVEEEEVEEGIEDFKDREKDLKPRPPVITVMGHVDHGKTSLLDAIRNTNVTAQESGGITQRIGATEVEINGQKIVFLDTPGHEAFTAMRARGAHITDIAVLVVAADDRVMPQTIESISHAKAADVPIIVAINKMDKPGANPDRVKKELADQGVLVEDWGGDVISVPVSAKTGEGITNLLEMILLQAEVLELKANPNRLALGSVIEAKLDKAKGPVASLLVMNGTLQAGQSIVAGTCHGRIRRMTDFRGRTIKKAGPATAVEILGLNDVPQAGDEFNAVRDEKVAREIAGHRQEKLREEVLAKNASMTLDKLFSQIQEGEVKELNLIIKADVQGSVGAMISSLEKLNNDEVKVNVVHSGVGTVTESDIMLAETAGAIIIGFNVRPSTAVTNMADQHGVEIRLYRVIYDVINDVEAAMKGMLDPEYKEEVLGKAEVRDTFKVPGVGIIAGAYITEGKVVRNEEIRLVRDGIVIHEGKISSLKRFKDDAKEVNQGYECGIGIEDYNDIKIGDVIECFTMVQIERK